MVDRKLLGAGGEHLAVQILYSRGFSILEKNYHCRFGEIDVICSRAGEIYFVEVKTRMDSRLGLPREAVNREKQARIRRCAQWYLSHTGQRETNCQFMVVEVTVDIIEDAF